MTKNANKPTFQMIDTATISIKAGNGGDGRVSFRREKFIPRGGPDGGDGGHGGSVYLVADNNMETLLDFRSKPVFAAQPGEAGQKKNMTGSNGVDLFIKLPVGTLVFEDRVSNSKEKVLVADMNEAGKTFSLRTSSPTKVIARNLSSAASSRISLSGFGLISAGKRLTGIVEIN